MSSYGVRLQEDLKDFAGAKEWYEKFIHVDRFPRALVHLEHLLHDVLAEFVRTPKRRFDCSSSLLIKDMSAASAGLGIITRWGLMGVVY